MPIKNHKLVIALLLCFSLSLPGLLHAQQIKKITLSVRNATMDDILQKIAKAASVRMVYNHELIDKIPRRDFSVKDISLQETMTKLLEGTGFIFNFKERILVISPKTDSGLPAGRPRSNASGIVTDNSGTPLFLATVTNLSNNINTLTDANGKFNIEVDKDASLLISYVGMKPVTVLADISHKLSIKLFPESSEADEVVITGYQKIEKRLSASSTYTLKGEEVKEPNAVNVATMLQGKVPGMSVVNLSGSVNAVPRIRIRGTSTLIGNANPVWVVDGIIKEDPDVVNPDNVLGREPDWKQVLLLSSGNFSKASLMGNSINGINVEDIESVTFLKDASATAIYGTRAANGVIVITTKTGKIGKPLVGYNFSTGFTPKPSYNKLQLMNSQERVQLSKEIFEDNIPFRSRPFPVSYEGAYLDLMSGIITEAEFTSRVQSMIRRNTDWFDVLFRNSLSTQHSINLSGGAEKTSYYASIGYNDAKGGARKDGQKGYSARVNLNSYLTSKLTLDLKLDGNHSRSTGYYNTNPLTYALQTSRAIGADEFYPTAFTTNSPATTFGPFLLYNEKNENEYSTSVTNQSGVNTNVTLRYKLSPAIEISSQGSFSFNSQQSQQIATERTQYVAENRGYDYGGVVPGSMEEMLSPMPFGGFLSTSEVSNQNWMLRNMINYKTGLFGGRDDINVMVGQESRSVKYKGFSELVPGYLPDRGEGFANMMSSFFYYTPRVTNTVNNNLSMFVSATYSLRGKYVFNANARSDASNRFGQYSNSKFLPVWSMAGRWNIIDEPWMGKGDLINDLALKASVGFQGNVVSSVGPDLIALIPFNVVHPTVRQYQLQLKSLAYPDLRWERTRSVNIELNASLFNSRLDLVLSGYRKDGRDIIATLKVPMENGIDNMLVNGGNIQNKGYEFVANVNIIRSKNLNWSVSGNVSKNYNTLRKGSIVTYTIENYINGSFEEEGVPISTFYGFAYKGLDPQKGTPLFYKVDDITPEEKLGMKGKDHLVRIGKLDPDVAGGLNTRLSYKAFSVNMQLAFSLGAHKFKNNLFPANTSMVPMPDENVNIAMIRRWRKPGDELYTNIPAYLSPSNDISNYFEPVAGRYHRNFMYDRSDLMALPSDFLRCRSMQLSYSLPSYFLKSWDISAAGISAQASNLFIIKDKRWGGQDPEITGVGSTALPILPSYSLSINVTF